MDPKDGEVIFTLNQANTTSDNTLVADMNSYPVKPDANNRCTVGLLPTTTMTLDAWYDVSIRWNQDGHALTGYLGIKIRVPPAGGQLKDLIDPTGGGGNINRSLVWVGQYPPAKPYPGMYWLQQEPGPDPDPFDPLNTSDLHVWRP